MLNSESPDTAPKLYNHFVCETSGPTMAYYVLHATDGVLLTTCYLLLTTHYPLHTTYHVLGTTDY